MKIFKSLIKDGFGFWVLGTLYVLLAIVSMLLPVENFENVTQKNMCSWSALIISNIWFVGSYLNNPKK